MCFSGFSGSPVQDLYGPALLAALISFANFYTYQSEWSPLAYEWFRGLWVQGRDLGPSGARETDASPQEPITGLLLIQPEALQN